MHKYNSRKLFFTLLETTIVVLVPIIYHKCGIDNDVTLLTLGLVGVSIGGYKVANIVEKKLGIQEDPRGKD